MALVNLDETELIHFIDYRKGQSKMFVRRGDGRTLNLLAAYLRDKNIISQPCPIKPDNISIEDILHSYGQYLYEDKGLCDLTIKRNKAVLHNFLIDQFGKSQLIPSEITRNKILKYIVSNTKRYNNKSIQIIASVIRSFLHYLVMIGKIKVELADCIPATPSWRASYLPVFLVRTEVKQLLGTCDRRTKTGCRNYAILLLLVRLGLRASEVLNLSLDDINWEAGELDILGKGRKHRVLPLPVDVGSAMASYLRYARPKSMDRQVFIRSRAPYSGLHHPSCISSIVRRALNAAKLNPQQMGAHLLRYTAAMETLNKGASLFEIGQLLGHCSVDTTALYTKIDITALRELTRAWPTK
jgi:site-specific recombinase XerD